MFALNGLYIHAPFPFNLYRYHYGGGVFFTSGLAAFFGLRGGGVRVRGVFRAPCGGGVRVVGSARCVVVLRGVFASLFAVREALRPCGFTALLLSRFVIQAARRVRFASACYGFGLASACYGFGGGALASACYGFGVACIIFKVRRDIMF